MTDAATRARDARELIGWLLGFRPDAVALVRSLAADAARLDWLDATNWVQLDRTDESDNNGVGAVNAAVCVRVGDMKNGSVPLYRGHHATFRAAIDAAMAAANARALADAFPVPTPDAGVADA